MRDSYEELLENIRGLVPLEYEARPQMLQQLEAVIHNANYIAPEIYELKKEFEGVVRQHVPSPERSWQRDVYEIMDFT